MRHFFESYVIIQQDIFTSKEAKSRFLSIPFISDFSSDILKLWASDDLDPLVQWHRLSDFLDEKAPKKVKNIF